MNAEVFVDCARLREAAEGACQSIRGRSLAAHFYVVNINYDYT